MADQYQEELPGFPLTQAAVHALLAKLKPDTIFAIASIADPVAAKQCAKQSSPYWIIDLAAGKTLYQGVDQPCFFPPPGGVSSSGSVAPNPVE